MKRSAWIALGASAAVLLTVVVVAAFVAGRGLRAVDSAGDRLGALGEVVSGQGEYTEIGPVTVQTIRAISELSTVEMVQYTTIEKGDDRGWLNWAAGDRIAMFAVAKIEAGIDLSKLEDDAISADRETGRIRIILPPSEITNVAVDNEATSVFDRDTGLFTKGDPNLERAARLAAEEVLLQQALDEGILQLAADRAIVIITELVKSLGYTDVEVSVSG